MATKARLGLVGLGNQGQEYLQAMGYCERAEIVAGFDINPATQEKIRSHYPGLFLAESVAQLQPLGLDGLIAALPHHCYDTVWPEL